MKNILKRTRIVLIAMVAGLFFLQIGTSPAQALGNIVITLPANRETWATASVSKMSSATRIVVNHPAHAVQSRVILGTNESPGAATTWQTHAANQMTIHYHTTHIQSMFSYRTITAPAVNRPKFAVARN